MNKNQNTPSGHNEAAQQVNTEKLLNALTTSPANTEDNIIMHEAQIITPQPYGVYALCKIMEHFQIN